MKKITIIIFIALISLLLFSCGKDVKPIVKSTETFSYTRIQTTEREIEIPVVIEGNWEISGRKATYIGTSAKAVVPNRVREVLVRNNTTLEEIHISKDVEDVWGGIRGENLKKITIDNENRHFKLIDGILYNSDVTKIASYPFDHPAKKFVVPETIHETDVRGGKNVEEIILHSKVRLYDGDEFLDCPVNLKKFTVDKNNPYYSDIDGVLFNKKQTTLLLYPPGRTGKKYNVPNTVIKIADFSFYTLYDYTINVGKKHLKTIVMPDNIKQFANLSNDYISSRKDVRNMHSHFTFVVKENSTTHKTLAEFGLNIEFK